MQSDKKHCKGLLTKVHNLVWNQNQEQMHLREQLSVGSGRNARQTFYNLTLKLRGFSYKIVQVF